MTEYSRGLYSGSTSANTGLRFVHETTRIRGRIVTRLLHRVEESIVLVELFEKSFQPDNPKLIFRRIHLTEQRDEYGRCQWDLLLVRENRSALIISFFISPVQA